MNEGEESKFLNPSCPADRSTLPMLTLSAGIDLTNINIVVEYSVQLPHYHLYLVVVYAKV
jgi:hypothetical protein